MGCSLRLQRFCCCCSLKTGGLVIGTAGWVFTLIKVFSSTSTASQYKPPADNHAASDQSYLLGIQIGYAVIALVASSLLIWGIAKGKRYFMLMWMILSCLEGIIVSLLCLYLLALVFIVPAEAKIIIAVFLVVLILITVLTWYCWLCVWSHYMDLADEETRQPPVNYSAAPHYAPKEGMA